MTKKKVKGQFWGWGLHVDRNGNLHDVFPPAHSPEGGSAKRGKWHVKPRKGKRAFIQAVPVRI